MLRFRIEGAEAQEAFGTRLAGCLVDGLMLYLEGDLGAGKTTLVRGLLRGLGHGGAVRSPTFTLMESYSLGGRELHHLDLYRLGDPEELEYLGIRDICDGRAILLVEWPDKGAGVLPGADLALRIHHARAARTLELVPFSEAGAALVQTIVQGPLPAGVSAD